MTNVRNESNFQVFQGISTSEIKNCEMISLSNSPWLLLKTKKRTLPLLHQKNMKMLDNITGTCISKKISAFQKENAQCLLCCRLSFLNVLFTTTTLAYSRHHHLSLHFIVVIKRRFYLPRQNKNI